MGPPIPFAAAVRRGDGRLASRRSRSRKPACLAPGPVHLADATRRLPRESPSRGRHFDTHPRAKVRELSVRQQAMAIDLRRREKQYVMVSNANTNPFPMAHNFARTRVDFAVERMDLSLKFVTRASSHLVSASTRSPELAWILSIAASILRMEAAERKKGSSWVSIHCRKLSVCCPPGARLSNRAVSISQLSTGSSRLCR